VSELWEGFKAQQMQAAETLAKTTSKHDETSKTLAKRTAFFFGALEAAQYYGYSKPAELNKAIDDLAHSLGLE
jgi:hypothetical protein